MPGWGNVPNPEEWAEIDALPDNVAAQGEFIQLDRHMFSVDAI